MKYQAIHQFHSGTAYGDAVTNSMFFTQGLLWGLGFQSQIYAEHIPPEIASQVCPYVTYRPAPGQALLVHHSMGHDRADWILSNPDPKLLVYHNITPARYFSKESAFGRYSEIGRKQLELYRPVMKRAICDSEYNALELRLVGYERPAVIPLLLDVEKIRAASWNEAIPQSQSDLFTVLFVGRINENKCQHHVIEVFRHLQSMLDRPAQLIFIGDAQAAGDYYAFLEHEAERSGNIRFLGKVPADDLYGWYRAADVFVCMSEHEGFGVPLIEAMVFDVPVIAYKSSSIPQTLGGAGLLVREKRFPEIAALIKLLAQDGAFRRAVIRRQRERIRDFHPSKITSQLIRVFQELGIDVPPRSVSGIRDNVNSAGDRLSFQIEGPYESSYSLAIVNREIAFALEKISPGNVSLFATEGPGDYRPDIKQIRKIPGLESLGVRGRKTSGANVVIRNLYPPRVADMDGLIKLLYFAWEESSLPDDWVQSFNRHLDGLTVLSRFVKKVLIDSGVHVPIVVAGCGIEQMSRDPLQKYRGYLGKGFRFLHVSSGFPRKGVDVLLQAYTREFTSKDPVSLVVKTFPNPHSQVGELIRSCRARMDDCPEIVLINEDLPSGVLRDLYGRCHAFVAPSRGEGFGLPMAEAMAAGIPVITTGAGGHVDFCTEETSWLIDYRWEAARTHMGLSDSVWAEPDAGHLGRVMREIFQGSLTQYQAKVEMAKNLVQSRNSWSRSAARVIESVRSIDREKPLGQKEIKLGWVTSWNTPSEIFAFSKSPTEHFSRLTDIYQLKILASKTERPLDTDGENVIRCWEEKGDLAELVNAISREAFDAVVIHFHFSLFDVSDFGAYLQWLTCHEISVILFLHDLEDLGKSNAASLAAIRSHLADCKRILVPCIADLNILKEWGLVDNVTLFPGGIPLHRDRDASLVRGRLGIRGTPVLATFGFLRAHKGVVELIQAMPRILGRNPRATLLVLGAWSTEPDSQKLQHQCQGLIESLGIQDHIRMVHHFLDVDEALCLLECADLLVFPYQKTRDSRRDAVRFGLASHRPVAVTPLDTGGRFDELNKLCHLLPGCAADDIADGINRLLQNPALLQENKDAREQWLESHSWTAASRRLDGMIRALARERRVEKG